MQPPQTRRDEDLVETLHGQRIPDPYRWLEDPDSSETAAWVDAQNHVTETYLHKLPARDWFTDRLGELMRCPTSSTPFIRYGRYLVSRSDGEHDQPIWYVADSLAELEAGGRVVVDPNALSSDGTSAVNGFSVSPDGSTLSYVRNDGGSDWGHFRLVDLPTCDPIEDLEIVSKLSVPTWLPENRSYPYSAWPDHGVTEGTSTQANNRSQRMLHRLGQREDVLVLELPDDLDVRDYCRLTHDGRLMVFTIVRGTQRANRVWVCRVLEDEARSHPGEPVRLIDTEDAAYDFIRCAGDLLYFRTDADAPNGRIVRVDLAAFERDVRLSLTEVVPEGPDLFAAAVSGVGVLDLLRFHKFTCGASWKSDYGDPDDPTDFKVALAYSPLHNVREGTAYPPTLVLTGDHDGRVVPLHSHKFTATLHHAQGGEAPVLTRIETRGGPGMGKPRSMVASEWADWLAFAAFHTGPQPTMIDYSTSDGICTITLNRPDQLNAFTVQMADELVDAYTRINSDDDARAVVVTGPAAPSAPAWTCRCPAMSSASLAPSNGPIAPTFSPPTRRMRVGWCARGTHPRTCSPRHTT